MERSVSLSENVQEKKVLDTLFSYLDKGIDDVEAGRVYTVDEAFTLIEERLRNEV